MPPKRIVVAGAGIVGASIAYHLAKRGAKVTVMEAAHPGAGATGKSFGWINATFSKLPRAYFDLNLLGMAGWDRLEEELHGELQIQWGGSVFWDPQAGGLQDNVRHHQQWGYATRLIDRPELHLLVASLTFPVAGVACFCEPEGAVGPLAATTTLLENARRFGAEVLCPREVAERDLTSRHTFVLACGVDSPRLARLAGVNMPLRESPGRLVHTTSQPKLIHRVVLAPEVHFKQGSDGRIVIGGAGGGGGRRAHRVHGGEARAQR